MKLSVNASTYLNQHYHSAGSPAPEGVEALVQRIGAQLAGVDEVVVFGERYEGAIVAKVVSCVDHPDADRLHICKLDDGGKVEGLERDEHGHVQVVCGAPNVREGLTVAWLPPGATVPETYSTDPFVLSARPFRGVVSNGMLASPREMAISDDHEGILEIKEPVEPGTPFVDAFNLRDDTIIDMENKMFTHRPDCFGWLGLNREIAGIYHQAYQSPEWYRVDPAFPEVEAEPLALEVTNEIPSLVPRFTAITMRDVTVGPSPLWLQIDLARAGIRSINNIVDYTNFYMLLTGQPLHAYDYDKVKAQDAGADKATIVIRHPKVGEKLLLLNGKEITPRQEAIMIATRDKLIGLGGVMGGGDTEVDSTTTNIILEAATFDMYSIRRTSMAHGVFSEAVTRFNKGQSPLQNLAVLWKIMDQMRQYAPGKVAGPVIDVNHLSSETMERQSLHDPVTIAADFVNARLGSILSTEEMASLLRNVEFRVTVQGDELIVTAPFWRTDIEIKEDVVEEVGRLYGYDRLPLVLPRHDLTPAITNPSFDLKRRIRAILARAGTNEVLTYSFVHGNLLDKVGQQRDQAFKLSNALSPDLQYMRLSLTPSLLERVQPNIKAGYPEFALFEMNKVHNKLHQADDQGVPTEFAMLSLVYAASDKVATKRTGAAYYQASRLLNYLASELGMNIRFTPITERPDFPVTAPFEPSRSAIVTVAESGAVLGILGEYTASTRRSLKLPVHSAGFEVGLDTILEAIRPDSRYEQLPRFPKVEQDISLRVPTDLPYQELFEFVWDHLEQHRPDQTLHQLSALDIYQRPEDPNHKQITLRLWMASYERTLTAEEVNNLLETVAAAAAEQFGAERL